MHKNDSNESKVYNMLVLGNGFDLAHGLKTTYRDFLDSINQTENQWVLYFKDQLCDLEKKGKNNWIDFENEIRIIIEFLEKNSNDFVKPKEYLKGIGFNINKDEEDSYELIKFLEDELDKLILDLNNYLVDIEKNKPIHLISEICDIAENIDYVLSFNYTHTYANFYLCNYNTKIHYIHGETNNGNKKTNNMVLGINEYLIDQDKNMKSDYIYFKKYFQRIYKKTGNDYIKWMNNPNNGSLEELMYVTENSIKKINIYIFGHSLDITDSDILKYLISMNNVYTTIYYYDEQMYRNQINNLVEILGQDKLIESVSGIKPNINFISQIEDKVDMYKSQFAFKRDVYRIKSIKDENAIENFRENVRNKNKGYFKDNITMVRALHLCYEGIISDINIDNLLECVDVNDSENLMIKWLEQYNGGNPTCARYYPQISEMILNKFPELRIDKNISASLEWVSLTS